MSRYGLTLILEFNMAAVRNFEFWWTFYCLKWYACDAWNEADFMLQIYCYVVFLS